MKEEIKLREGRMSTEQFPERTKTAILHFRTTEPAQVQFYTAEQGGVEELDHEKTYTVSEVDERMTGMTPGQLIRIESNKVIEEIFMDWEYVGLITPEELSKLTRMSYIDDDKARCFIDEAEQNDVRSKLGDPLYGYICSHVDDLYDLLAGCTYETQCGDTRYHAGLKKALAYYAYSRLIVGGNIELTRAGMVNRDSDYSYHSDIGERQQTSRETAAIADRYLNEVLDYCRNDDTLKQYVPKPATFKNTSRTNVTIIGE